MFIVNVLLVIPIFGKLVFPKTRHHPIGKETGQTSHIERFNCTLRLCTGQKIELPIFFKNFVGWTSQA